MKYTTTLTLILLSIAFISCNEATDKQKDKDIQMYQPIAEKKDTSVQRGEYLVKVMECNICHTPNRMTDQGPRPDASRLLSGYPASRTIPSYDPSIVQRGVLHPSPDLAAAMGPWGISFSANLTPDQTGLGSWTYEQFKKALQEGKYKGMENGRTLLPPMPWQAYSNLKEADLQAIFNYLQSIPAVENVVPAAVPPQS
jgi:mono/diheme cytochrome c family protein